MMILAAAALSFTQLVARPVKLRPELEGVHPRVFVTRSELANLRERARTTHREDWSRVVADVTVTKGDPPPAPGPQERRSQNNVAYAIAQGSIVYAVDQKPEVLAATKRWLLAAIDYEPWGYTYYKPNVDLAAGHLLYAIGWSYDLLYDQLSVEERTRVRKSLERHARLVHDYFAPVKGKRFNFTQNHNFIPVAGLAVASLALMGESDDAPKWAALARAHHVMAGELLSPDGHYYESFEYWIFSAPWLVHFADAWEHSTGEDVWNRDFFRNWKYYLAHTILPNGHDAADFGDIWEGPVTRAKGGKEYGRLFPGGKMQSNYNLLYATARRFRDPQAQAVAERMKAHGHSNLEEYWTLLWRDASIAPAPISEMPLFHHFEDSGVVFSRSSWDADAAVLAFKAGPPEGHRALTLEAKYPDWRPSAGHAHPDANSFIVYANGKVLTGDTGYAGMPQARHHNTITVGGTGQGVEGGHDVWEKMPRESLAKILILEASSTGVVAEAAGAYPPEAGVEKFTRELRVGPGHTIKIRDTIVLKEPKIVSWHLNADVPFTSREGVHSAGDLEVRVKRPAEATVETSPLQLMAPGRPGSIVSGSLETRGHQLVAKSPAAARVEFEVELRLRGGAEKQEKK